MLTREERVKSFAHRNLKQLENYQDVSEYNDDIPFIVDGSELVGVYSNTKVDRIFITLYGLYLENLDRFLPFNRMTSLGTDWKIVGKKNVDTINISLDDDEVIPLRVLGKKISVINDVEFETMEVWSVYTFLIRVHGK